jgi:hypothetical protein
MNLKIKMRKSPPKTTNIQKKKVSLSHTNKIVEETYIAELLQEVSYKQAAHPHTFHSKSVSNANRFETGCRY